MNKSKVDTVVSLIPFPGDPENQPNNYKISTSSLGDKTRLSLLVSDKEEEWHVDSCNEFNRQSTKEKESLINYALAGFSTCALIMSQGDAESLYERRERDLQLTLQMLQEKMNQAENQIKLEYACIGIRDVYCFDLRKDKVIANESILRSGLEHYMKKADDVNDIWKVVKDGSKIPFVLSIRLTDTRQKTQGILELFDLLRPKTVDQDKRNSYLLHDSFTHLVRMIQIISHPQHQGDSQLQFKDYVLTFLLAKKLVGHTKLAVFTYLNDFIPKKNLEDASFILNLTEQLGRLISYVFPNEHSSPTKQLAEMRIKNQRLRELLQIEQAQVVYLEAARTEALIRPSSVEMDLRLKLLDEKTHQHLLEQKLEELQLDLAYVQRDQLSMENNMREIQQDYQQLQHELSDITARYEESQLQLQQLQQAQPVSDEKYEALEKAYEEAMEANAAKIKELKAKYRQNTMTMRDEVLKIHQEAEQEIEKAMEAQKEWQTKYEELRLSFEDELLANYENQKGFREQIEQELMEKLDQRISHHNKETKKKRKNGKKQFGDLENDSMESHETTDPKEQTISDLSMNVRRLQEELKKLSSSRPGRPRKTIERKKKETSSVGKQYEDFSGSAYMSTIRAPNPNDSTPPPLSRSPSPVPVKRRKYKKRVKAPDETYTQVTSHKQKEKEAAIQQGEEREPTIPQRQEREPAIPQNSHEDDDFMEALQPPPPKVVKRTRGRPRKRKIGDLPLENENTDDIQVIDKHKLPSPEIPIEPLDQELIHFST
ncbi:hypothetical protein EDC96DRAFT_517376 [Choanephora cucurbitarum]|nr:hypothetical protein EDC96DRAFT_517376 [Choanephora cucurbitarum]